MKKSQMLTIVSMLALAGILTLLSLEISQIECEVCMDFKGRRNCATVAAPSRSEAIQGGRMTACGTISGGVRDSFGCNAAEPAAVTCS
jgi:hypothetical protein